MIHSVPVGQATVFLLKIFDSFKAHTGMLRDLFAEFVGSQGHLIQSELLRAQLDMLVRRQAMAVPVMVRALRGWPAADATQLAMDLFNACEKKELVRDRV
eukprot:6612412-Prymnesium_polylepis.1